MAAGNHCAPRSFSLQPGTHQRYTTMARILRHIGLLSALLVVTLVLFVQTPWGGLATANIICAWFVPNDVRLGGVRGNWFFSLELHDMAYLHEDGTALIAADTLRVRHRPFALLRGSYHAVNVSAVNPVFNMPAPGEPDEEDTESSESMSIVIDRATIINGTVQLPDSTIVSAIQLRGGVQVDSGFVAQLQEATAEVALPNGAAPFSITARGVFADGSIQIDTLGIAGPASQIGANGHIVWSGQQYGSDFRLAANPVVLTEWMPESSIEDTARLDLHLAGSGEELRLQLTGRLLGGNVDLDMQGTPRLDGPVSFTIREARLDGLSLAGEETQFTGVLVGRLAGPSLSQSSGTVRLTSSAARVGGHALAPIRLDAQVEDGKAAVHMVSGIWQSIIEATGWVRPFDHEPTYAIQGRFDGMDIGTAVGSHTSMLNGTYRIGGEGRAVEAELALEPSTVNDLEVRSAALRAAMDERHATMTLQLDTDQGDIVVIASAILGDTLRLVLERASWNELDIAALAGLETHGMSTGNATFTSAITGKGIAGRGTLSASDSYVGNVDLEYLESAIAVGTSGLRATFTSLLEGENVAGSFSASWSDPNHLIWQSGAQFENLDAATLGTGVDTNLNGELVASGYDAELLRMDLELADSRINKQPVDTAWVAVSYADGKWPFAAGVDMPESRAWLAGEATPDSVAVHEVGFNGLDLGKLLGAENLETRLNGAITAAKLLIGDTLQAAGFLRLDASLVKDQAISSGSAAVDYSGGDLQAFAHINLTQGSITLDSLRVQAAAGHPDWILKVSADGADLSGLGLPQGSVNVELELAGAGMTGDDLALYRGHVVLDGTILGALVVPLMQADVRWQDGVLAVDTLEVVSNALRLAASGGISLRGTKEAVFAAGGVVMDAGPVAALAGLPGLSSGHEPGDTLWLNARSDANGIFMAGRLSQTGGKFDDMRWLDLDADLTGHWEPGSPPEGRFSGGVSRLSVPAVSAQSTSLDLTWRSDTLSFAGSMNIDSRRSARLRGYADLQRKKMVVERVSLDLDLDRWRLDQAATISLTEGIRFRNLLLTSDDQEIALDGVLNFGGEQNLGLTIYDFRLGSVADLVGYEGLDGIVNGSIRLRGSAEYPQIRGNLDLVLESLGTMAGSATYSDGRVLVDASLNDLNAGTLSLKGYVPADWRLRREAPMLASRDVDLVAEADKFDTRWVTPWLDEETIARVGGALSGTIGIEGTPDAPELSGAASFTGGEAHLPLLGITVTDMEADMQLSDDTAYVMHFSATSGGMLTGSGTVGMEALALGELALDATLDRFLAINTPESRSRVTGDIQLRGTTSAPIVTGTVRLTATDIWPTQADSEAPLGLVALTEADLQMLERHFNVRATVADTATFDLYEAMAMNLDVIIGDDVWLRARQNPEMHVLLTGVLGLTKAPYQEPQIQGTVQAVPVRSYIRQFGRRFDIRTGRVTFLGPAAEPLLDFRASYEVTRRGGQQDVVTIIMDVDGSLHGVDGLELELSSEPVSLDQADIISYIATGRPAADAFQLAGTGTLQVGGDLARQQLAQLIAAAAGAGLGLDVVEIQMEGSRGATITAGKYVSRRLFASVSLPLSASDDSGAADSRSNRELTIEYSILAWLLARLQSNPSTMGISLLYQYVY